ncbi:DUF1553 domain-containing protein [Planctomycetes bacterium K23_9]|uniref:Planctomycete cytochrome C n=1 Tax=Stieleria marina TaxID=1930275 RepID=A0A517NT20_9BACT|nr:Planctomycete cytochrome C [Planctomycetes bacterium K23_9]
MSLSVDLRFAPAPWLACLLFITIGYPAGAEEIRFDRDVRPILSDKCFFCHGPDTENRQAGYRLDLESDAKADCIVPGDPESSELIARIVSDDVDMLMPPPHSHKQLSSREIEVLTKWVQQGAAWSRHWSFVPPQRSKVDNTNTGPQTKWGRGRIDDLVLAKMIAAGGQGSAEANREKLLRRVSFDLTGLPPSIQHIDDFVGDPSPGAFERVVDRLLQSDHFGERMAMMWMDAARYGDTSVYHADGPRDMWAWRDAVVDAYNANMPFDQFSSFQLAGDLIDDLPLEQKILAGFNRNNGTTDEGGAIAEEYRVEYAVDRVKTTATVWLGLTMECAQCHDHKYDPISQKEYYQFYSFFNVSSDGGMQTRKGNAEPKVDIADPAKQAQLPAAEKQLAESEAKMKQHQSDHTDEFAAWLTAAESKVDDKTESPTGLVVDFRLDEGKSRSVVDSVDAKRKGKIEGKPLWVDARDSQGLEFNGKNYVDLGDLADFEHSDAFSFGGWVKPSKSGHGALLARMDDGNDFRGFDLLCSADRIEFHMINTWPSNALKVTVKPGLAADQWQHLYATYDGSAKPEGIKIYVDGKQRQWKVEQDSLTKTIRTKKSLLIGSRHPGSRLHGLVDEISIYDHALSESEVNRLSGASVINELLAIARDKRTPEQSESLRQHYFETHDDSFIAIRATADSQRTRIAKLREPMTSVMLMGDMQKPRETYVLNRGAYDTPTDKKVSAGTLAVLPPMSDDLPRNRLGLAKWLFQDDHPLTARVAVNRYWQMLFGRGLVSTAEDFGAQGDYPSHPQLLDELAVDFRESGWNIKQLIKRIVLSATYRQSAKALPDQYRSDPQNILLSRGPRFRLPGEMIRDNALFVSGLLVDQSGGPGVKPYQPAGLWAEVGLGGNPKFVQDHGKKLYRRSLYTYWKRSAPPPAMQIFDAPTREKCTLQRARTNTPLQALVTLNDVQFVEAARHFAQRVLQSEAKEDTQRIEYAFRSATARVPSPGEVKVLLNVLHTAKSRYSSDTAAAANLVGLGESPRDESIAAETLAAWTIVTSSILNLDETLVRE